MEILGTKRFIPKGFELGICLGLQVIRYMQTSICVTVSLHTSISLVMRDTDNEGYEVSSKLYYKRGRKQ